MTIIAFAVIVGVVLAIAVGVFFAMRHNSKSKSSKRQIQQELHELPLSRPFKRGYTLRDPSRAGPVRSNPGQTRFPAPATHATDTTGAPSASSAPTSSPFPLSTAFNLANALKEFYQPSKQDSVDRFQPAVQPVRAEAQGGATLMQAPQPPPPTYSGWFAKRSYGQK